MISLKLLLVSADNKLSCCYRSLSIDPNWIDISQKVIIDNYWFIDWFPMSVFIYCTSQDQKIFAYSECWAYRESRASIGRLQEAKTMENSVKP